MVPMSLRGPLLGSHDASRGSSIRWPMILLRVWTQCTRHRRMLSQLFWPPMNQQILHQENYVSISFQIEWDMIVVTEFLSPRSNPIQFGKKWKLNFLSECFAGLAVRMFDTKIADNSVHLFPPFQHLLSERLRLSA